MKNILSMTVEDFQSLPKLSKIDENIVIDSIVILPAVSYNNINIFRNMSYILCKEYEPIGIISGNSDILHINGVDGTNINVSKYPSKWHDRIVRNITYNSRWKIDCLPCGLVRLISKKLYFTHINCSDVEVYTKE